MYGVIPFTSSYFKGLKLSKAKFNILAHHLSAQPFQYNQYISKGKRVAESTRMYLGVNSCKALNEIVVQCPSIIPAYFA